MTLSFYSVTDALPLRVVKTDRFKVGYLAISAVLPIERERVYMTTLLLSVLRRGTVRYPTLGEINRRLDYLYGAELAIRNFYRGDAQIIGFSAELLNASYLPGGEDTARDVLEVLCQILFHPLLDENGLLDAKYVESEKKQQCDMIRALKNNPRAYAADRLRELMLEGEPCAATPYGTEEEVMAVTPEALTAHWRELISALAPECFYVGGEDPQRLCRCLRETVGAELTLGRTFYRAPVRAVPMRRAGEVRRVDEEMPVSQSHLLLGYQTDGCTVKEPAYRAFQLLSELLGGSPVSKLFVNVRERLSLCYSCSSGYDPYKGVLTVYCGIARENRALAEAELQRQVEAIAKGDFTDAELEAARRSLVSSYRQIGDSPAAIESFFLGQLLTEGGQTPESARELMQRISREDVIAAAKRMRLDTVYFLEGTLAQETDGEDGEDAFEND